jgi:DNA-binding MarR family transcriptional regulator
VATGDSAAQSSAPEPVGQIEQALGALLRLTRAPRFAETVRQRAGAEIDRAGYGVLVRVAELGPVRLSELAQYLGLDVSTVSRQVQQLEQRGLVERSPDPLDGRASLLDLSEQGRETTHKMRDAWCETVADVIKMWKPADVARFGSLLDRFVSDVGKYLDTN